MYNFVEKHLERGRNCVFIRSRCAIPFGRNEAMVNELAFMAANLKVSRNLSASEGIGTLSEKHIHKVLKLYFEPREEFHEAQYLGSIADVKNEQGIIEIQTRAFDRLLPKLEKFLPELPVTVVYPLVINKKIVWLDPETGEFSDPRRSTRKGRLSDALPELSKLASIIPHERLTVKLVLLSVTEYNLLDGWDRSKKRGSTKLDKTPDEMLDIIELKSLDDYRRLIPDFDSDSFTAKDFNKKTALKGRRASFALKFLLNLGFLEREKGEGRAYVYRIK